MPAHALPAPPFSCAWTSDALYREATGRDPLLGPELTDLTDDLSGTRVEVDGWDEALRTAWAQVMESAPSVAEWVRAYRQACGGRGLIVSFSDSSRVVGRGARDYFGVTYPAHLLVEHEDRVAAMRAAIVTVPDRHVRGAGLDVPQFSEASAAG